MWQYKFATVQEHGCDKPIMKLNPYNHSNDCFCSIAWHLSTQIIFLCRESNHLFRPHHIPQVFVHYQGCSCSYLSWLDSAAWESWHQCLAIQSMNSWPPTSLRNYLRYVLNADVWWNYGHKDCAVVVWPLHWCLHADCGISSTKALEIYQDKGTPHLWLGARLGYLQCISNGDIPVLCSAMDVVYCYSVESVSKM